MSFLNDVVFNGLTANASLTGTPVVCQFLRSISVTGNVGTGVATGTLFVQVSNDQTLPGQVPTNWVALPTATVAVTGPGNVIVPKIDICNQWARVIYTDTTGGTGTARLTAIFHAQSL